MSSLSFFSILPMQTTAFLILVFNLRAISALQFTEAVISEMVYLAVQWKVLRKVANTEETWAARAGYMCGGALGTFVSMWLTRAWG